MNTYRKTYILIGIFFVSLLALLGLEYTGVPTDKERRLRESRILPDLVDTPEASIRKLAIERGKERLVFERRGQGIGRWQMIEPLDAAAEPTRLETLVRNLKELRQSPDSGTHHRPRGRVRPRSSGGDGPALGRPQGGPGQDRSADRHAGDRQGGPRRALRPPGGDRRDRSRRRQAARTPSTCRWPIGASRS